MRLEIHGVRRVKIGNFYCRKTGDEFWLGSEFGFGYVNHTCGDIALVCGTLVSLFGVIVVIESTGSDISSSAGESEPIEGCFGDGAFDADKILSISKLFDTETSLPVSVDVWTLDGQRFNP